MNREAVRMGRLKVLLAAAVGVLAIEMPLPIAWPQAATRQNEPALRLPKLSQPVLPQMAPPSEPLEIPQAFFGCWEGTPGGIDTLVADPGIRTSIRLGRIVFCFSQDSITVPDIDISLVAEHGMLDFILSHLGLGYSRSRVLDVKSQVFRVNGNQILTRTTITFEMTESWIYKLPTTHRQLVTEEELATIVGPASMFVSGQQFMEISGSRCAADWHASFHHW